MVDLTSHGVQADHVITDRPGHAISLAREAARSYDVIAAVGLGAYGLFVVVRALRSPNDADPDMRWATLGLPLPLSIDNVAAGASLGLLGYSPWLAPLLFGTITFVVSVAGHQIGRTAANFIPRIRTDLLTGIAFVAMAALVASGAGG